MLHYRVILHVLVYTLLHNNNFFTWMVIYLAPNFIICAVYTCNPCLVYYSLLKSIDLSNREKAFKYLVTSSLFEGGQITPVVVICCIKELLWGSSILHAWIRCSTDCSPSLQGHIGLSVNLNLCRVSGTVTQVNDLVKIGCAVGHRLRNVCFFCNSITWIFGYSVTSFVTWKSYF